MRSVINEKVKCQEKEKYNGGGEDRKKVYP